MDDTPAIDPRNGAFDPEGGPPPDPAPAAPGEGERERRLAEVRAAIERGLEDVRAGRVADLDAALDRIEAMLDEIEAAKKA